MIRPDQIPDEVVEAAAKAVHDIDRKIAGEDQWPMWKELSPVDQRRRTHRAKTAIAAAINAWPEAKRVKGYFTHDTDYYEPAYILPLPKEPSDE